MAEYANLTDNEFFNKMRDMTSDFFEKWKTKAVSLKTNQNNFIDEQINTYTKTDLKSHIHDLETTLQEVTQILENCVEQGNIESSSILTIILYSMLKIVAPSQIHPIFSKLSLNAVQLTNVIKKQKFSNKFNYKSDSNDAFDNIKSFLYQDDKKAAIFNEICFRKSKSYYLKK